MKSEKILLVGCGEIGSRHLQALGKIEIPIELWIIDPNLDSLKTGKERFEQIPINKNIKSVEFQTELPETLNKIDLCIISTTSKIRFSVFQEVTNKTSCKNFILEKVLFQDKEAYFEAGKISKEKGITCWVNNYRREERYWKDIRKLFVNKGNFELFYGNADWHLCTNIIHILDLVTWLSNEKISKIDCSKLNKKIFDSKRSGFIELTGIVTGTTSDNGSFKLESISDIPYNEVEFVISNKTARLNVKEEKGEAILMRKENNWAPEKQKVEIRFQSDVTHHVVKSILETNHCNLPTLEESTHIHIPVLDCIMNHVNKISDKKYKRCPIT